MVTQTCGWASAEVAAAKTVSQVTASRIRTAGIWPIRKPRVCKPRGFIDVAIPTLTTILLQPIIDRNLQKQIPFTGSVRWNREWLCAQKQIQSLPIESGEA